MLTGCCDEWRKALEPGTDNEMYGALIYPDRAGTYLAGCELAPLRFCPWCGARVSREEDKC